MIQGEFFLEFLWDAGQPYLKLNTVIYYCFDKYRETQ